MKQFVLCACLLFFGCAAFGQKISKKMVKGQYAVSFGEEARTIIKPDSSRVTIPYLLHTQSSFELKCFGRVKRTYTNDNSGDTRLKEKGRWTLENNVLILTLPAEQRKYRVELSDGNRVCLYDQQTRNLIFCRSE